MFSFISSSFLNSHPIQQMDYDLIYVIFEQVLIQRIDHSEATFLKLKGSCFFKGTLI